MDLAVAGAVGTEGRGHVRERRAVDEVRERGWGEADEEREEDLAAIAVPVFDHTGGLVAILGVQGPSDRFDADARRAALPALQTAARELGRLLGAL